MARMGMRRGGAMMGAALAVLLAGVALGQVGGGRGGGRGAATRMITPPLTPASHPAPLPPGTEDFKTIETCQTASIVRGRTPADTNVCGYLGVTVEAGAGKLNVTAVAPDSPAARAGIQVGDTVLNVDGHVPGDEQDFRDLIQSAEPGTQINLSVARKNRTAALTLTPLVAAVSRPMSATPLAERPSLGVRVNEQEGAARVMQIDANSSGARAGLRIGDFIIKVDEVTLSDAVRLADVLATRRINDVVALLVERNGQQATVSAQLDAPGPATGPGPGGRGGRGPGGVPAAGAGSTYYDRIGQLWRKDSLKLAIIGLEYPDVKHNPQIASKAWEDALFSHGTYKDTATGQPAYGSEYDYYFEQSYGQLKVEGAMLPWLTVSKNRMDYSQGSGTGQQNRQLLTEAITALAGRDGANVLDPYDAIIFVYAGARVNTTRGGIYWPHKSTVPVGSRRLPYVIIAEGVGIGGGRGFAATTSAATAPAATAPSATNAVRMTDISVLCHESGHVLGLPDLYAPPENPGAVGAGMWCVMSQQAGNGRPQQMCAWSKEQLGWIKPVIIDPRVRQKLVLGPIEDNPKECYKVLVKPDGSEYFLLENRARKGFDASLPGAGLLIWRVAGNRPELEESHGIEGPAGPGSYLTSVPYPSAANDSFTPFTTPSSRSKLGGGSPVYVTNIKRMTDGRISFWMGYPFE